MNTSECNLCGCSYSEHALPILHILKKYSYCLDIGFKMKFLSYCENVKCRICGSFTCSICMVNESRVISDICSSCWDDENVCQLCEERKEDECRFYCEKCEDEPRVCYDCTAVAWCQHGGVICKKCFTGEIRCDKCNVLFDISESGGFCEDADVGCNDCNGQLYWTP